MRRACHSRSPSNARWQGRIRSPTAGWRSRPGSPPPPACRDSIARHEAALAISTAEQGRLQARAGAWRTPTGRRRSPRRGLPPTAGLAELRSFLTARDKVIQALEAERIATQAADSLAACHAGFAAQLAAALQTTADTLPRLIAAVRHRVSAAERTVAHARR